MSCRHLRVLAVMYFSEWAPAFCEIFSGLWYTLKFLFLLFHVLLEQHSTLLTPPLWKTVHCFGPPGKDLLFSDHSLLSAPILSSFYPPLLLRREHSLSLEGLWCKSHCPFNVWRVTWSCLCHHTSVIFIGNISGFTFWSPSRSTYCSNSLAVSHVWVMACDKQIHHAVDHFPFTSSQVINSCSGNHTKKLPFASSYPTVVLELSTVFPWLRIHSICGNDVVMFGECGLF